MRTYFLDFIVEKRRLTGVVSVLTVILLGWALSAHAVRIKDIVNIEGVRQNQLVGYGLIVGLEGTGDGKKAEFTIQSMVGMLEKMGVTVASKDIDVDNVAAVMVTANLPAFARSGSRMDVLVSSIADCKSLQGGTLIFTPLKAANGQVYAVAQGPVSIGGFSAGGGGGIQKNFLTVGRIANGALIERELPSNFAIKSALALTLNSPDFTTVTRVVSAINAALPDCLPHARDAGTIEIKVPDSYLGKTVDLVTLIQGLDVAPDSVAKIVLNERTGTVVIGKDVRISTVAIAHGNLSIEIKESADVSQPLPFSEGETTIVPETETLVREGNDRLVLMEPGISISDLVRALNALGVSPRDLIAIFQSIKAAGALQAQLEII
jgi:flagellar P-ring protein precursor FlgI